MINRQPKFVFVYPDLRKDVYDGFKYLQHLRPIYLFSETSRQYDFGDEVKEFSDWVTFHGYRTRTDLLAQLRRYDPEVIMCAEPYFRPCNESLVCLIFSILSRKHLCFMQSGTATAEALFDWKSSTMKVYLRLFSKFSDIVFYENKLSYRALVEARVNPRKIRYLSWFVDTSLFTPDMRESPPPYASYTILFAGRLCEEKGIRYLLDAFESLLQSVPDAKLTVIGQGPLSDLVEQVARRNPGRIEIVPRVKGADMPHYYRAADVLCAPSISTGLWAEEFGTTIVQSMACGTPVVSTFSGGIPEKVISGQTGILVPERDSAALGQALLYLFRFTDKRRQMGQCARERAVQRYDAQQCMSYLESLLLESIASETSKREYNRL